MCVCVRVCVCVRARACASTNNKKLDTQPPSSVGAVTFEKIDKKKVYSPPAAA